MRVFSHLITICLATSVAAQAGDTSEPSALAKALSILTAPVDSEFPAAALTANLNVENGQWLNDGEILPNNTLILPTETTIRLNVTSKDAIYEMAFPKLQLDLVAIPGRIETSWISFTQPGLYSGECLEECRETSSQLIFDVQAATASPEISE